MLNFTNVIQGEYTEMTFKGFENIDLNVRMIKNGKYSVMFEDGRYDIKVKRLGYKLRSGELVVNNESELIEILQKLDTKIIAAETVTNLDSIEA